MNEWGAYYSPPFLLMPATIFASPRKLWAYRWNVLIGGASARWHVTVSVGSLRGGRRAVCGYWEREREKEEVFRCIYFAMATVIADFSYSGLFLMLSEGVIFYLHNMLSLASFRQIGLTKMINKLWAGQQLWLCINNSLCKRRVILIQTMKKESDIIILFMLFFIK